VDQPEDEDEGPSLRADDPKFIEACGVLRAFFDDHPQELFYDRQLCVLFEKSYFHWITSRALKQLAAEGKLATDLRSMPDLRDEDGKVLTLRFYRHKAHRYWQRQANEIANLVRRFAGEMGHAIGAYGEILCDAGLGAAGFARMATNTREWNGVVWEETGHNLDRIYVKDGIAYGCEIKNTLKYITTVEREIKTRMCALLGVKPLFVVRWLPKSHMYDTIRAGGYGILFEHQLYPVGQESLAKEIRERLGLPAQCLREFPAGAVARFVKLHERDVRGRLAP
jgi:hypothetical protein